MKLRYLGFILLWAASLGVSQPVQAGTTESVTSFDQNAVLSRGGNLSVTDQIDYDYGPATPHDISFTLPLAYHDDQGRDFRMSYHLINAQQDGKDINITPIVSIATARITLPSPASGTKSHYTLKYTLGPVILRGLDADIFKLSATGLGWSVPIDHASVRFESPTKPADNVTCYTGAQGSTTGSCTVDQQANIASVTSYAPLLPGETLSIFSDFPHASFSTYLEPYEQSRTTPLTLLTLTGLSLGGFIALVVGFTMYRRRSQKR